MAYARWFKRRIVQPWHSRLGLAIGVVLAILGLAASEARAQQTDAQQADPLQRASTLYQKAQTAYEAEEDEDAIDHLEQIEELLADRSGPAVDTLRARRLALLSKAQYRTGALGGAQRAHIKMMKTGAVPPALAAEMAKHRQRVETALMGKMPRAVRASIRTAAAMDTLDLSGRNLFGLPDSVGRLTPRQRVDLSGNDLPSLPESIGQWTEVREMDLSDNRLGCVPESIGQLSRLEELDLSGNRLTELPASIGRLPNLRGLDLSGNELSDLPDSIGQLTRLRRLDLSGNALTALPSSVDQLTRLRTLNLSGNLNPMSRQVRQLQDRLPDSTNVVGPSEPSSVRWLQTAQIRFPVTNPTLHDVNHRALLDTLTSVLARRDTVTVRRSPDAPEQPFSELNDRVVDSVGVAPLAATHARVDYTFRITNLGFEEEIRSVHFLYQSEPEQAFVPLLFLDSQQPWMQDILKNKGLPTQSCRASLYPFEHMLSFADVMTLRDGEYGTLLQISGNDVRDGFEQKKRALIKKIRRLIYESM